MGHCRVWATVPLACLFFPHHSHQERRSLLSCPTRLPQDDDASDSPQLPCITHRIDRHRKLMGEFGCWLTLTPLIGMGQRQEPLQERLVWSFLLRWCLTRCCP